MWEIAGTLGLAAYFRAKVSFNADWASRDVFSVPDDYFVERRGREALEISLPLAAEPTVLDAGLVELVGDLAADPRVLPSASRISREAARDHPWFFEIPAGRRLSVHVRRGDYLEQPRKYVVPSKNYYQEAIARFPGMTPVIFSDDRRWCMSHFPGIRIAPRAARPEEHFALMSLCERHIIANSTFSYWAAVVAGDEEAIYPRPWFGPDLAEIDLRWSIPPAWTPLSSHS